MEFGRETAQFEYKKALCSSAISVISVNSKELNEKILLKDVM
jgi:hypothetical protein